MNIKKYLKIYSYFNYSSLSIELEYKINLLIDLITSIFGLIGSVFLLSIFLEFAFADTPVVPDALKTVHCIISARPLGSDAPTRRLLGVHSNDTCAHMRPLGAH